MTFSEFLVKRRIEESAFAAEDAPRYAQWQTLYAQMHPNSFYNSVKMVLNDVRRRFHLAQVSAAEAVAAPAKPKPVIRRAPSAVPAEPTSEQAPVSRQPAEIVAQQSASVLEEKKTEEAVSQEIPKPAKPRPVFKRPAQAAEEIAASEEKSESAPETPVTAPRPRPVFKRPSAAAPDQPTKEKAPEPKAESPAGDSPKPPKPRPVFKRPAATPETKADEVDGQEPFLASNPENSPKTELESGAVSTSTADAKPATPRPRPVFKRPSAEVKGEGSTEELSSSKQPLPEQPEAPTIEVIPSAKPPRPRPVFKRPALSTESVQDKPKDVSFSAQNPENRPKTEDMPSAEGAPEETPSPKTPRPRPIFKRPSPSAEGDGNPK
ncbi:hypothetical protein TH61_08335 [Rufibacter sp. DG15C]|uniref:hypothetical protein n=1 Tax=Rufibacter sp. DG15C TaxID=1379909 RepID=UPI00078C44E9|nr:hypothetical protein [Rufibacter sp. DG15C]AMM51185.1 hypothetical protein TH61_08335 [Rufibacter sp. DG15C]